VDYKLFATTFVAIFLAEMGDKTQLATLSAASGGASRWVVFAAAALALVSTTAIAVLAGEAVSRVLPPVWTKRAAGALFVLLGVLLFWSTVGPAPSSDAKAGRDEQGGAERG
jgi:putative Ca2+/H+ antiporter (TMEM165/GDT1 family)